MNKHIRVLFAFSAICASISVTPAFASDSQALRVRVPFPFRAGAKNLPAGDYTVSEGDSHIMKISGTGGSATMVSLTGTDSGEGKNALTFEHRGGSYILRTIYSQGRPSSTVPER